MNYIFTYNPHTMENEIIKMLEDLSSKPIEYTENKSIDTKIEEFEKDTTEMENTENKSIDAKIEKLEKRATEMKNIIAENQAMLDILLREKREENDRREREFIRCFNNEFIPLAKACIENKKMNNKNT